MVYDDSFYFGHRFRELRHSPCFMAPLSLFFLVIFGVFGMVSLFLNFPGLVLGLILAPILQRNSWYVEFLYPWSIARWGHFLLIARSSRLSKAADKNRGFHSRAVEQRIEVVPGRVYIHPIPQWLDNVGYLVVCLPPARKGNIVGLVVDCGEAEAVVRAVELVERFHYGKRQIEIQSILSTHKHHDHTGGNGDLLAHEKGSKITRVFGGAVEKVPHCTDFVTNGELLTLPHSQSNDMNQLVEIEAIAVPSHTRGSLVYRLSGKFGASTEFLFTGDTVFSGGGGVAFEADIGFETEKDISRSHGNTFFRGGIGAMSSERCFAEIVSRSMPMDNSFQSGDRILIFPGHEYTSELLSRQFQANVEACRWRLFSPKDFFQTASQLYLALHRRTLPHNTGKLLCVPSTLSREVYINPTLRSMKRSGEMVVRAIQFWFDNFCKKRVIPPKDMGKYKKKGEVDSPKTDSTTKSWTMDANNFNRDVFTTIYTEDLESVIQDLASGKLGKNEGAAKLREMSTRLSIPVVNKRAIPGFLPSDKNIWKGVSGLARLGSGPSAMTLSDSRKMKLPPPIDSNSDRILISMNRLLLVLGRLGLLQTEDGEDIEHKVKQLWTEASDLMNDGDADTEWGEKLDEIELGVLKWTLFGVPSNQPSWISKNFCMPCSKVPEPREFPEHPACHMKQKAGELVSHDVYTCLLCRNATGCLDVDELDQEIQPASSETPSDEDVGLEVSITDANGVGDASGVDAPEPGTTEAREKEGAAIPDDEKVHSQPQEQKPAEEESIPAVQEDEEIPFDAVETPPPRARPNLVVNVQETVSDDEEGTEMPLDELAHHLLLKDDI
eukprot:scaffold7738_cov133-Cylindrotheca_fusiformis.AAC.20